jgi:small subunit ribosomal protein S20
MPVIKSAIKKQRQDIRREAHNDEFRKKMRDLLRNVGKKTQNLATLSEAYTIIDKAAKRNLIHANKAARLKSQIARKIKPVQKKAQSAKPVTTA